MYRQNYEKSLQMKVIILKKRVEIIVADGEIMSNFSFSQNYFKSHLLQIHQNVCWNGLKYPDVYICPMSPAG